MWKQPRCLSTEEWIVKWWYIYTKEYYSAIKRNEFESVLVRWMNLEPVIQRNKSERDKFQTVKPIHMQSRKNGTDGPICRAGIDMQTQTMDM